MPRLPHLAGLLAILIAMPSARAASAPQKSAQVEPSKEKACAFAEARTAYAALRKDPKRRKFHDQWMAVAQRFETVAKTCPSSSHAAEALLEAADLYAELSRVSLTRSDLRQAIEAYGRLCEKYPRSPVADDAHLALGKIYRDRKGDAGTAEVEFRAAAACKGDAAASAKAALAELASLAKPAKPAKVDKPEKETPRPAKVEPAKPAATAVASKLTLATRDEEDEEDASPAVSIPVAPKPAELDPARVKALKAASRSEVPLSVQVGLKVKRVIIDAGHGGIDAGAIGQKGVREKDATLSIALELKERLEAHGYEALLTREDDAFVSLEDRARFANKNKGDLFVSIHCNALKNRAIRGVETYTLNVTGDLYSIRLAARENASSERRLSDLQYVLADLATKANTADSVRLARAVQSELVEAESESKYKARNLGIKQALFYVLLGVRMPSVLVETAFLSNAEDEKHLADPEKQKEMAEAIASGIERFVAEREQIASALP